jgi:hypothetical protein
VTAQCAWRLSPVANSLQTNVQLCNCCCYIIHRSHYLDST